MDTGAGVPAALRDSADAALAESFALVERFHGAGDGRLEVALAPRFVLSCSDRLWEAVADAAGARGLRVHTHLAESPGEAREVEAQVGTTAARHLERKRVLDRRLVVAHGVWLDVEERGRIARADAALVHCPGSNLKLGSGFAAVAEWREAGIRCGLGSDGAACNNRLDPFHEMSLAAGIARARRPDRPIAAREVFAMATSEGARALGLDAAVGSLEPGKQADLAVVDVGAPHHGPDPLRDPYATLVHAARPDDVRLTMVAGRVLYHDRRWTTLDRAEVLAVARQEARALAERADRQEAA
jgi:5-methylthioadenosine/S-adenosylhomocysteine deaminase